MTQQSPLVSIEEAMQTTGLTKRMIRFDIRNGYMPGEITHRGRVIIRRTEWNQWLGGYWKAEPVEQTEERKPLGIVSIGKAAS